MNVILSAYCNPASALLLRPGLTLAPLTASVRFRTRRSTRLKREALKARMKILRATMPKPEPKPTFMQRVMKHLMRGREQEGTLKNVGLSSTWPARSLKVDESIQPEDDVFRISSFDHNLSLPSAIAMFRQLNQPTIYDDPKVGVRLRMDLNMNLDPEAQECLENFQQMIVLPHPFEFGKRRVVMAFTKQPEAQMAAREAGAEFAGGEEVIRKIKRGEFKIDEVDYFVANIDLLKEVTSIRGLLRDKVPTQNNGLLGLDVVPLVKHYRNAITLEVKRDESNPIFGVCEPLIGRLDMADDQLEANAAFLMKRLCEHRPMAASLGHFIFRAALVAPERKVFYQLDFKPYVPPVPLDDSALQAMVDKESGKKIKRKKKK